MKFGSTTRRGALAALAGAVVAFTTVAAPTDPRDEIAAGSTGQDRLRRHRRQANNRLHDFDAIPPAKETVLTRRGRRERIVEDPPRSHDGGDVAYTVVKTRRGRRLRATAISKTMAQFR